MTEFVTLCFISILSLDILDFLGLLQPFILSYEKKKKKKITDIDVYKSLIWLSKLNGPNIDKIMSKSL